MILKVFCILIISFFCTKIINATTFDKETIQGFLDHPHLKQILIEFVEAGFNKLTDKEERETKLLQIMFKNEVYIHISMEAGFGEVLVKYLRSKNPILQYEAIKSVKKAAVLNTEYAEEIVDEGAIPELIRLLHSTNPEIVVGTLKSIVAIIFKNHKLRNQFLKRGLAEHLVEFVEPNTEEEILLETVQAILVLTLDTERPLSKSTVRTILPAFRELIHHSNLKIAKDITWALVFLTDGGNQKYNIHFSKEVVEDLFKLINHQNSALKGGAVGVICNIVNAANNHTKMALDNGLLKLLPELLMQENTGSDTPQTIVKDILLLLTKFFANPDSPYIQAKEIFDTRIIPLVIYHLARGAQEEQQEAAYALSAAASFGNETHISKMVDLNVIIPMCNLLIKVQNTSDELVEVILNGLSEIVLKSKADRIEEINQDLEKCGGIELIGNLGENGKDMTKRFAHKILKSFCTAEKEAVCRTSAS